jgi:hypothetical protein
MRMARRGRHTRNFEARFLHKNGRVATLTWSGAWSEGGQQHSFIGREVTEQKLAEEKFRLAVEASSSGMVMVDAAGLRPEPTWPAWFARPSAANPTPRRRSANQGRLEDSDRRGPVLQFSMSAFRTRSPG